MKKPLLGLVLGVGIFLSAGCGSSEYDWYRATATNTLASYQAFLRNHPKSDQADTARGIILALQDDQAWKAAQSGRTTGSYQTYLTAYPGGVHAEQAHFEITALERAAGWRAVQRNATYPTLQGFLKQYPEGQESNLARERLARMSYRARFADVRTRSAADRQRSSVQMRLRDAVQTLVVIPPSATDKNYQVTSGILSQAQARAACAAAAQVHQRCVVLPSEAAAAQS
ncbi:MAG: tetratricopeptide repeat protein [Steroidobacteraceae bacterium]